jgi:hypothetical protein
MLCVEPSRKKEIGRGARCDAEGANPHARQPDRKVGISRSRRSRRYAHRDGSAANNRVLRSRGSERQRHVSLGNEERLLNAVVRGYVPVEITRLESLHLRSRTSEKKRDAYTSVTTYDTSPRSQVHNRIAPRKQSAASTSGGKPDTEAAGGRTTECDRARHTRVVGRRSVEGNSLGPFFLERKNQSLTQSTPLSQHFLTFVHRH